MLEAGLRVLCQLPILLGLAANRSPVYNPLAYGERISLLALKAPGDHRGSITPNGMTGSKDGLRGPSADASSVKIGATEQSRLWLRDPGTKLQCWPFRRPTAYAQVQFSLPALISPWNISEPPSDSRQRDPIWFDTHLGSFHAYRDASSVT